MVQNLKKVSIFQSNLICPLNHDKQHNIEVWCSLFLSKDSRNSIHDFFKKKYYIDPKLIVRDLHLTLYHSRRPMWTLEEAEINCYHKIDTLDTRFMVMFPGGENPREDLIPGDNKVGIRVHKQSEFRTVIDEYRKLAIAHEDSKTLGNRLASSRSRNAFGSRHFQPHITLLKSGSGITNDLTTVADEFRDVVHELVFDKYVIQRRISN